MTPHVFKPGDRVRIVWKEWLAYKDWPTVAVIASVADDKCYVVIDVGIKIYDGGHEITHTDDKGRDCLYQVFLGTRERRRLEPMSNDPREQPILDYCNRELGR